MTRQHVMVRVVGAFRQRVCECPCAPVHECVCVCCVLCAVCCVHLFLLTASMHASPHTVQQQRRRVHPFPPVALTGGRKAWFHVHSLPLPPSLSSRSCARMCLDKERSMRPGRGKQQERGGG